MTHDVEFIAEIIENFQRSPKNELFIENERVLGIELFSLFVH